MSDMITAEEAGKLLDDPFKNPGHLANAADAMGRVCENWQSSTARYHFACRDTIRALMEQLADAEAAQALVLERAVEAIDGANGHDEAAERRCKDAIRALAPASGAAALAALRAERDEWKRKHGELQDLATEHNTAVAKNTIALTSRTQRAEAERDDMRARLAAAEAQVGALKAQVARLVGALEPFRLMSGELFARNWNASDVVIALDNPGDPHRLTFGDFLELHAALAAVQADARREGGE